MATLFVTLLDIFSGVPVSSMHKYYIKYCISPYICEGCRDIEHHDSQGSAVPELLDKIIHKSNKIRFSPSKKSEDCGIRFMCVCVCVCMG